MGPTPDVLLLESEHCHSIQDWLWPGRRGSLKCDRGNDEMQIVADKEMIELNIMPVAGHFGIVLAR